MASRSHLTGYVGRLAVVIATIIAGWLLRGPGSANRKVLLLLRSGMSAATTKLAAWLARRYSSEPRGLAWLSPSSPKAAETTATKAPKPAKAPAAPAPATASEAAATVPSATTEATAKTSLISAGPAKPTAPVS